MKQLFFFFLLFLFFDSYGQEGYLILHHDNETNKDGYLNTKGDTIIPFGKYCICYTDTLKNYAIVMHQKKGLIAIDRHEKFLFNVFLNNNRPDSISEGTFRITDGEKIGYADINGNILIKPKYKCATPFKNGIAKVTKKCDTIKRDEYEMWESENWFYINKSGEGVMPPRQNVKVSDVK